MNSERELVLMMKADDHHAFKSVFDLYARKVYSYAYKFVKTRVVAEDITQDVFKKLWEKRIAINENKTLSGFIFTLCYHGVIDHFRKESKQFIQVKDELLDMILQEPASEYTEQKEMYSIYRQAIDQLPEKRREIYLLSRHEGLSNNAIAEKLNISVKTVENQMTSALHFIRYFFKSKEIFMWVMLAFLWHK
jgi:RNA polymerase sigma-70 factor (ECF subfamily)